MNRPAMVVDVASACEVKFSDPKAAEVM